jgi:hypothetical protein
LMVPGLTPRSSTGGVGKNLPLARRRFARHLQGQSTPRGSARAGTHALCWWWARSVAHAVRPSTRSRADSGCPHSAQAAAEARRRWPRDESHGYGDADHDEEGHDEDGCHCPVSPRAFRGQPAVCQRQARVLVAMMSCLRHLYGSTNVAGMHHKRGSVRPFPACRSGFFDGCMYYADRPPPNPMQCPRGVEGGPETHAHEFAPVPSSRHSGR